jgi:hypothetical protein
MTLVLSYDDWMIQKCGLTRMFWVNPCVRIQAQACVPHGLQKGTSGC